MYAKAERPAELLRSLVGLYPFAAKKGIGSFIIFRLTSTPETPKEDAYFRIDMCAWFIREAGDEIAHSESPDAQIEKAVSLINGRQLDEIVLHEFVTSDGLRHGASLLFSNRLTIKLQQYEGMAEDNSIFEARTSSQKWISYLTDGSFNIVEADRR